MSSKGRGPRRRHGDRAGTRPVLVVALALMLVVTGLTLGPAHAATELSAHAHHHGSAAMWASLGVAALASLRLTRVTRRGRDAAIVSLTLVVAIFGLESAIHSAHHLSDAEAAASCAMFSASQHVPGGCAETPHVGTPTWNAQPDPVLDLERTHPLPTFRSHESRAPPTLPSA